MQTQTRGKKVANKTTQQALKKEACPTCNDKDFSIAEQSPNHRTCSSGHVWLPMTFDQIQLNELKHKFGAVKDVVLEVESILDSIEKEKDPGMVFLGHQQIRSAVGRLK